MKRWDIDIWYVSVGIFEIVTAGFLFQRKLRNVVTCNVIFVQHDVQGGVVVRHVYCLFQIHVLSKKHILIKSNIVPWLLTRHVSRYLCYGTTCAVTNSNTRAETYQISILQRPTRHVSRYLCYATTSVVIISNTREVTYIDSRKHCNMHVFLHEYLKYSQHMPCHNLNNVLHNVWGVVISIFHMF